MVDGALRTKTEECAHFVSFLSFFPFADWDPYSLVFFFVFS